VRNVRGGWSILLMVILQSDFCISLKKASFMVYLSVRIDHQEKLEKQLLREVNRILREEQATLQALVTELLPLKELVA
jgi:hypothetical protein